MDRPECRAAVEFLRQKGTDAPAAKLFSGLRSTLQRFEQIVDRIPETTRRQRPAPAAWSVHEIVDHLVESHRPAVAELRSLCAGVSPTDGPIPARLTSLHPMQRPWGELFDALTRVHAELLEIVAAARDSTPLDAKAPFVMVVKVPAESGAEVLEWVEQLNWKAYAQALRVHTHEHAAQVQRTLSAVSGEDATR